MWIYIVLLMIICIPFETSAKNNLILNSKGIDLNSDYVQKFFPNINLINIKEIQIDRTLFQNDTIIFNFKTLRHFTLIKLDTIFNKYSFLMVSYNIIESNSRVILSSYNKGKTLRFSVLYNDTTYSIDRVGEKLVSYSYENNSNPFECGLNIDESNLHLRKFKLSKKKLPQNNILNNDFNECKIRIFVAYLPSAITSNRISLRNRIIEEVNQTNQSYINSNVNLSFEIARTFEIKNYNEYSKDVQDILNDFTSNQSHEIHKKKVDYFSDVLMIVCYHPNDGSTYGIAHFGGRPDFSYDSVIAVTRLDVGYIDYTFTHELGHLQGCAHQTSSWWQDPPLHAPNPYFKYGHAYKVVEGTTLLHSIMYTGYSPRTLHWSNPDIELLNQPFGTDGSHNNARVLRETKDWMISYKKIPVNYVLSNIYPSGETIEEADIADISAFETINIDEPFVTELYSIVTIKAGQEIRIGPGFHSKDGSNLHAFIQDQNCSSSSKNILNDDSNKINTNKLTLSPNPTTGDATAKVEINKKSICSLTLFDNLGNEVITIFKNKELMRGVYEFDIETSRLSSGVYFCILRIDNTMQTQKLVFLK